MGNKDELNEMARKFYLAHGYEVEVGYDFSKAQHPQERAMWAMAVMSYNYWSQIITEAQE